MSGSILQSAATIVVRLHGECPKCHETREVKPEGDGFVMKSHRNDFGVRCIGGTADASNVLRLTENKRRRLIEDANFCDARRNSARTALAEELDRIDAQEAEMRRAARGYERAIAKIKGGAENATSDTAEGRETCGACEDYATRSHTSGDVRCDAHPVLGEDWRDLPQAAAVRAEKMESR